jgi:hypothetical protein
MKKYTEADHAAAAKEWFEERGWEIYPEVLIGDHRADMVAVQGSRIAIIEVKTSASLALLDQAVRWATGGWADHVVIVHPRHKRKLIGATESFLARQLGLTIMTIWNRYNPSSLTNRLTADCLKIRDVRHDMYNKQKVLDALHEDQKRFEPGTKHGYSTPFSRTLDCATEYIEQHPGCVMKEIVANIDHHYRTDATAKSQLANWLVEKNRAWRQKTTQGGYKYFPVKTQGENE